MDNTVDPNKLKKAPIASSCFMGLGQILYLKQYVRGALFALVEVVMLCSIIFGTKKIIPANNSEYDYLKTVPETAELVEYLEDAGYSRLDSIMASRAKAMEKFFTTTATKGIGSATAKEIIDEAQDYKNEDKDAYKEALAEAKQAKVDAIEEYAAIFAEYDYESLDDVDEASYEIMDYDTVYDKYLSISSRYDHKLAKVMAKMEAKKFNKEKKNLLPEYKAAVAEAKENYKEDKASLADKNKQNVADIKAAYKTALAALKESGASKDDVRKFSVQHRLELERTEEEYNKALVKARFAYEDDLKDAFSVFDGHNEFDEHYDGCSLCKRAANGGKRTTMHRAWFRGPLVTALAGIITLGDRQNTSVTKFMDHSIFMMINGIFAIVVILFFIFLYQLNINGARAATKKIIKNNKFPTMKEAQNDLSQNSFATIGIAPSVVMIAIFSLIPLLFSALVAFTNYSSPDHVPPNNLVDWVGLSNFVTMFSTKVGGGEWAKAFGNAAVWTIVWAIFATFTCFFVGFFYAFVLQDKRVAIPAFYRTVYILPYAIPTMLSLFVWANLLNGTIGPINRTLQLIGLIEQPIPWLSNPNVAKFSLIFVNIWIGFPYSMILTTSSMTAISNSLYEAAVIDGATKWQQFKSITYPLVMFQLKPTLIMQFAGNINNFGAVFFLTGGGPNMPQAGLTTTTNCGATDLLISWIYKLTMNTPSRYQLASVLSLLVFVVLVPFALYNFTRTKSFKEGEL